MLDGRLQDLSVIYWLKNLLSATFINVEDGFPDKPLVIPMVAVEWDTLTIVDFEIGNRAGVVEREYYIDIFAKNKSQRDELAYMIIEALKDSIPVYDYNAGFPPDVTPVQIGCLLPIRRTASNIPVMADLVDEMYYRATIEYVANFQNNR